MVLLWAILTTILIGGLSLGLLWVWGRLQIVAQFEGNERKYAVVREFRDALIDYANSHGTDRRKIAWLHSHSPEAESALGIDNYPSSLKVGFYMLNGAAVFPFALREMQAIYEDDLSYGAPNRRAVSIAGAADTILLRNLGRREKLAKSLESAAKSFWGCVGAGWRAFAQVPLALLRAFGVLSAYRQDRVAGSLLFRLWSLVLALALGAATVLGPAIGYLADKNEVDSALASLWQ